MPASIVAAPRLSLAFLLDWAERLSVCGLFGWMVTAKLANHETGLFFYLYCISEGLVCLFILARRGTDKLTTRPFDWFLAVTATVLPMFSRGGGEGVVDLRYGAAVFVIGACWQIWAKLVLRRSFGLVAANRGVKVSGPYRYMRHPMYFGYLLTHVGLFLTSPIAWNVAIYVPAWTTQILRILAEEKLLNDDPAYRDYSRRVRFRLIPLVF